MKIVEKPCKALAKKLWHIVKVLYYMLHRTVSKHKLMLDLNLCLPLERSKVAGKAIGNLLSTYHHHHHDNKSFYVSGRVELSCSNTPFQVMKRKGKHHVRYDYVSDITKAFDEILSFDKSHEDEDSNVVTWLPTPKVTDSPFMIKEEEDGEGGSQVDREAEEFIQRFYEQLRLQEQRVRLVN